MYLPEWEMEEIVVSRPDLLRVVGGLSSLHLLGQQFYLPRCGGFIDLLYAFDGGLLVVELKNELIDDVSVIKEQVAKYVAELAAQPGAPGRILAHLVSTHGFTQEVEAAAREDSVMLQTLSTEDLIAALQRLPQRLHDETHATARLLQRRLKIRGLKEAVELVHSPAGTMQVEAVKSAQHFLETGEHNEHGLRSLAKVLSEISQKAPLMAHAVLEEGPARMETNEAKWFWIFYSVLDRRANASTFIKAKAALEKVDLFLPQRLVALVDGTSYDDAVVRVLEILESSDFPLSPDKTSGKLSMPKSIIEAALYVRNYKFDIDSIAMAFYAQTSDKQEVGRLIMRDMQRRIYGVGPRIAAQILRGMVLRGGWQAGLAMPVQLERCEYNEQFAGPFRLNLAKPYEYEEALLRFATSYLDGNCGVISHCLWFIRKRYCPTASSGPKKARCYLCPVAGYCHYIRWVIRQPDVLNKLDPQLELFLPDS